ncbi:hypothetical protein PVAP13_7NG249317 [Panicum virgatum]|uniref:Uncharacterized protein n=1 Tax=Panicum virgatum TaxID=38727 RepID=A0A8T0Q265_PANVG|nr:hypothetical protein PVAP13_7NG249317 [Panicum virgatum]
MLRVLRSETLHWISLLNTIWSSLSRSTISNSRTCNCSSLHATLFFWNALETRDHLLALGITISFDRRCNVDSIIDRAISLASDNSLMTLQQSVPRTTLLFIFLNCFCIFLTEPA